MNILQILEKASHIFFTIINDWYHAIVITNYSILKYTQSSPKIGHFKSRLDPSQFLPLTKSQYSTLFFFFINQNYHYIKSNLIPSLQQQTAFDIHFEAIFKRTPSKQSTSMQNHISKASSIINHIPRRVARIWKKGGGGQF